MLFECPGRGHHKRQWLLDHKPTVTGSFNFEPNNFLPAPVKIGEISVGRFAAWPRTSRKPLWTRYRLYRPRLSRILHTSTHSSIFCCHLGDPAIGLIHSVQDIRTRLPNKFLQHSAVLSFREAFRLRFPRSLRLGKA